MAENEAGVSTPEELPGLAVLHLFFRVGRGVERGPAELAMKECQAQGYQVLTAEIFGHKADLAVLALGPSFEPLRTLQTQLVHAGLELVSSYVSLTELSEYAAGVPDEMKLARLRPVLPPEGMPAFCFYPMSKRRLADDNWYRLRFEERRELMVGHGATGREFRGRVLQLVTGSTGLDDFEWGVTLFALSLEDVKDCVYQMRFDEASSRFAEFGPFFVGSLGAPDAVLDALGVSL